MKRWLIGSLALNVVLLGVGGGFFLTSVVPGPPKFPMVAPRPGIQRDLLDAAKTGLSGEAREHAIAILERHFKTLDDPSFRPPRPDDILEAFVDGHLPEGKPFADPHFEDRRRREAEALRGAFSELIAALDRSERQAFAAAIRVRVDAVRACFDSGGAPPKP